MQVKIERKMGRGKNEKEKLAINVRAERRKLLRADCTGSAFFGYFRPRLNSIYTSTSEPTTSWLRCGDGHVKNLTLAPNFLKQFLFEVSKEA